MCSGRVDLAFVLRAFANGTDGVFIGGCHLNECHYITDGNYHALSMVLLSKKIMQRLGLKSERLRLESVSAGEGVRFAEIMNDFGRSVKSLGPIGKGEGMDAGELKRKLLAATRLVPYIKLVEMERLRVSLRSEKEYNDFFASEEFDRLFNELIADKLITSQILLLLRERPLSGTEISGALGLTPADVSRHMSSSARQGLIRYDEGRRCFSLA